jgi:hypothetical protein
MWFSLPGCLDRLLQALCTITPLCVARLFVLERHPLLLLLPHRSFTGSAGTALVTLDKALLWTDGRYYLQAESELGADWTLMRGGSGTCPEVGASVSTLGVTRTVYLCHHIGCAYIAYLFDPWYGMRHTWPLGHCGRHMQPGPFSPCLPET